MNGMKKISSEAKKRSKKTKKLDSDSIRIFWDAPSDAFFGQEIVAHVTNSSVKTLECNRWRKLGIPFRKVSGRVLYRKVDVVRYLESHELVLNTSQYEDSNNHHFSVALTEKSGKSVCNR